MNYSIDDLIRIIKDKREQYEMKEGRIAPKRLCEGLGVELEELLFIMGYLLLCEINRCMRARDIIHELERENEHLKEYLDGQVANGRERQIEQVKAGLPIARKKSKSLAGLELLVTLGNSDAEIMKHFGISRTTLWRWKKELEEVKRSGNKRVGR